MGKCRYTMGMHSYFFDALRLEETREVRAADSEQISGMAFVALRHVQGAMDLRIRQRSYLMLEKRRCIRLSPVPLPAIRWTASTSSWS